MEKIRSLEIIIKLDYVLLTMIGGSKPMGKVSPKEDQVSFGVIRNIISYKSLPMTLLRKANFYLRMVMPGLV